MYHRSVDWKSLASLADNSTACGHDIIFFVDSLEKAIRSLEPCLNANCPSEKSKELEANLFALLRESKNF